MFVRENFKRKKLTKLKTIQKKIGSEMKSKIATIREQYIAQMDDDIETANTNDDVEFTTNPMNLDFNKEKYNQSDNAETSTADENNIFEKKYVDLYI